MKTIISLNPKISRSGKSFTFKYDDMNWSISLEVLNNYDIKEPSDLDGAILELDEGNLQSWYDNWYFINKYSIKSIVKPNDKSFNQVSKEVIDKKKAQVKIKEEQASKEVFTSDYIEEKSVDEEIDFEAIYQDIKVHEIENFSLKMTKIDKLIEKSVKLIKTKWNNGIVKTDDYTYDNLSKLAGDDLIPFLRGKTNELLVKYPKKIKIPEKYKDDKQAILQYLEERKYLVFATQTSIIKYENELLAINDLIIEIQKKLSELFWKLNRIAKKSTELKYETGFNPFVIAWPYLIGKTEEGTFIHAPICYQEIEFKTTNFSESVDYNFTLTKSGNFKINTYPILKNYTEQNSSINEIQRFSSSIKDVLIEYYKHGIKIKPPENAKPSNYKWEKEYEDKANSYSKSYFELTNEVLCMLKPNDELIHSDLRLIRKKYSNFSIPNKNISLYDHDDKKYKNKHIFDLDDSKTRAIAKALKDSIVIWGPPGTGKSQAISAIIGEFINKNKSSIVIAEKSSAIDVIESNLKKIDLDSFILNINNDSKMDFIQKFNKQLKLLLAKPVKQNYQALVYSKMWLEKYQDLNAFYKKYNDKKLKEICELTAKVNFILEHENSNLKSVQKAISFYENLKINFELEKNRGEIIKDIESIAQKKENNQLKIKNLKEKIKTDSKSIISWFKKNKTMTKLNYKNIDPMILTINKISRAEEVDEIFYIISSSYSKKNWIKLLTKQKIKKNSSELIKMFAKAKKYKKQELMINNKINDEKKKINNLEIIEKSNKVKLAWIDDNKVKIFERITSKVNKETFQKIKDFKKEIDEMLKLEDFMLNKHEEWQNHKREIKKHIKLVKNSIIYNAQINFQNKCKDPNFENDILRIQKIINTKLDYRGNSIRELVYKFVDSFKSIFNSLMMAPEYVSTIFSDKKNQFDYAIFDEASQIRLHKALPAIHRSHKIIVAGDEKQLGPTDLFTDISNEKDEEITSEERQGEDFDEKTLLNFAKIRYSNVKLTTHYRSKSKQLIAFSNENFYKISGIELNAVDSPLSKFDGRDGIIVEEINGKWREDRTNLDEANRVVELFNEYLSKNKRLSIGIVTFNDHQKKLIQKLLEEKFYEKPDILNIINNPSKFFVKSIKDVQGDEKDIIIFSITYGARETSGKYVSYFGYFSKEKINVAITRAKLRMHVLKSLPSFAVDAKNDDYQIFKKWLKFLESDVKKDNDLENYENSDKFSSKFEKDFYDVFINYLDKNYKPLVNYPVGHKKIDLVVWHKINKSFICAIELDGAKYHSTNEQMENDYNRQILLENMGWKFIRLSAAQFYSNRVKAIEWVISEMKKIENLEVFVN